MSKKDFPLYCASCANNSHQDCGFKSARLRKSGDFSTPFWYLFSSQGCIMFTYHHMGPPFYSRCCVNSMVIPDSRSLVMFISSWLPKSTPEFSVKCKALVLSISGRGADTFLWRIDGLYDIQSSRKARQKEAGGACAFLLQLRTQPNLLTKPGWDSFRWVCWQVLHNCRRRMGVTFLNYLHYDWRRTRSKAT